MWKVEVKLTDGTVDIYPDIVREPGLGVNGAPEDPIQAKGDLVRFMRADGSWLRYNMRNVVSVKAEV